MRLITLEEVVGDFSIFGYTYLQMKDLIKFAREHGWKPKETI